MKADVKEFWDNTFEVLDNIPVSEKMVTTKSDYHLRRMEVTLRSWRNIRFQSLLVIPRVIPRPIEKAIIYVGGSFQGYKPRPQFWFEDAVTLMVDPRGQGHSQMDISTPDHFIHDIRKKESYRYRGVYCDFRRAIDWLTSLGYKRIAFAGTCFGGGVAVAMAALDSRIKCVVADTPWPCAIKWAIEHKIEGYEQLWGLLDKQPHLREEIYETIKYFDPLELAPACKVPTLIGMNKIDPVVHEFTMKSLYEQLGGTRCLIEYDKTQHGCSPEFTILMRDWIRLWL